MYCAQALGGQPHTVPMTELHQKAHSLRFILAQRLMGKSILRVFLSVSHDHASGVEAGAISPAGLLEEPCYYT